MKRVAIFIFALLLGFLLTTLFWWKRGSIDSLVVYCAHDSLYSEEILNRFERETGIPVTARFDTEATKSLGLVEQLMKEKESPRCDVFWNNELLGTARLARENVLAPYKGTGYTRIPDRFKDPDGLWTGFGARLRVYIVNTDLMEPTPEAVETALKSQDLSSVSMAKPLYGTTFTEYLTRWQIFGGQAVKEWHKDLRNRGLREVSGNATSKNAVADGACKLGWTDTDDYFVAKEEGAPVAAVPVRVNGATISIPNTVSIIRGTRRMKQAQQLVDYLLSAETEIALANSRSRQIPLGPVPNPTSSLPSEVVTFSGWAQDSHPARETAAADNGECLAWLKSLYVN